MGVLYSDGGNAMPAESGLETEGPFPTEPNPIPGIEFIRFPGEAEEPARLRPIETLPLSSADAREDTPTL
jgi:hypothetical protein